MEYLSSSLFIVWMRGINVVSEADSIPSSGKKEIIPTHRQFKSSYMYFIRTNDSDKRKLPLCLNFA